jgi:hypothetical protein
MWVNLVLALTHRLTIEQWFAKEPEFVAAVEKIEGLARKYNKAVLGFAFPEMTEVWEDRIRKGYKVSIFDQYLSCY